MTSSITVTISVVSHGQSSLIRFLLADLAKQEWDNFEVVITLNLPEDESPYHNHPFPFPLRIIRNARPKGFGENHNAAFNISSSKWFAVVNPDIRINTLDLENLLSPFKNQRVAAVAPLVFSGDGKIEDSARRFPTLVRLAKRTLLKERKSDYEVAESPYVVDWVAGMFIVFRREAFNKVGGFDDRRFFMYLEDADICRRMGKLGLHIVVNPNSEVIHLAQRASRRNIKHMRWHMISVFRYLTRL